MQILNHALAYDTKRRCFLALLLLESTLLSTVAQDILDRLCRFEASTGKAVPYAINDRHLHIYLPEGGDLNSRKILARRIIAHLTDSILPHNYDIPVNSDVRHIYDQDPSTTSQSP